MNQNNASMHPQEADPTVGLEIDAATISSFIRNGSTHQRLTDHGRLIVGSQFLRQVGFRTAHGGTPPTPSDQPHRLSSQRHRLALSERYPLRAPTRVPGWLGGSPIQRQPRYHPRTSWVGTDLRAVRRRRHGAFGEIALPRRCSGEAECAEGFWDVALPEKPP